MPTSCGWTRLADGRDRRTGISPFRHQRLRDEKRGDLHQIPGEMKQQTLSTRLMTLSFPDDELALEVARYLAQRFGGKIVVTDSEGKQVGTATPKLDS